MDKNRHKIPLSQSNVSLRLRDIQDRCSQLIESDEESDGLSLLEPISDVDEHDPYDLG